jgi:chemotaxis response regulator CheB
MNKQKAISIFLVDTNAVIRDSLPLVLEKQGDITLVGEASNGLQTTRKVKKLNPDIVLMDIAMHELKREVLF